ncbi:MAG: hypothetical protein ACTHOD_19355 [Motilibacteraceae bacterium]
MRSRALALVAGGTTALAALLAGCGGGSSSTTSAGAAPASSAASASASSSAAAADPAALAKAQAVLAAFAKAGLPTGTPVDHTADTCTPVFFDCTAFVTTEKVSVMVLPDAATAQKVAASFPASEVHAGTLLARFSDPVPAAAVQQRYQQVLAAQSK